VEFYVRCHCFGSEFPAPSIVIIHLSAYRFIHQQQVHD
jgi:hypothetical protein